MLDPWFIGCVLIILSGFFQPLKVKVSLRVESRASGWFDALFDCMGGHMRFLGFQLKREVIGISQLLQEEVIEPF